MLYGRGGGGRASVTRMNTIITEIIAINKVPSRRRRVHVVIHINSIHSQRVHPTDARFILDIGLSGLKRTAPRPSPPHPISPIFRIGPDLSTPLIEILDTPVTPLMDAQPLHLVGIYRLHIVNIQLELHLTLLISGTENICVLSGCNTIIRLNNRSSG